MVAKGLMVAIISDPTATGVRYIPTGAKIYYFIYQNIIQS